MIRRAARAGGRVLILLWGTTVIAIAVYTLWQQGESDDRASERDAARAYQRCEQQRPTILVVSTALDQYPVLRAAVRAERPEVLDENGHLEVPDCRRIYPRGAAVSHRYPDIAPTTTPTRSTP